MATDTKVDKPTSSDIKLLESLKRVDWGLDYGSVKVQIREGKPTLVIVERTIRLD